MALKRINKVSSSFPLLSNHFPVLSLPQSNPLVLRIARCDAATGGYQRLLSLLSYDPEYPMCLFRRRLGADWAYPASPELGFVS